MHLPFAWPAIASHQIRWPRPSEEKSYGNSEFAVAAASSLPRFFVFSRVRYVGVCERGWAAATTAVIRDLALPIF